MHEVRLNGAVLVTLVAGCLCLWSQAAWNGAGVPGGTGGTNINDTANWVGGTIDDNFSTITQNADLQLTADYTTAAGLNFAEPDKNVARHITVSGTNTITLRGYVVGHDLNPNQKSIFLPSNQVSTVTLNKGLKLDIDGTARVSGFGIFICDAQIIGSGQYLNQYSSGHRPKSILRNDASTFTGQVSGDSSIIYFTSIADKGESCAMGAGNNVFLNNFYISYIGSRDQWTDRDLGVMNGNVGIQNDSCCGGLSITGNVSTTFKVTGLNLGGISAGEGLITDAIESSNLSLNYVKLTKIHSGTWRLTGKNTFRGYTNETYALYLYGGTLIADYADDVTGVGSNRIFLAGRSIRWEDTNLEILGKSGAGNTTVQEFGYMAVADSSANALTVDGNGGDGTTVVIDSSYYMGNAYGLMLFDSISEGHISATSAFSADSGTLRNINGVLLGSNGARANLLIRDSDGKTGFATQDGAFEFVRHTNTLALTAGNAVAADHLSLASDLTRTAALNFSTLDIDASANAVTLDMGGNLFQNDGAAKGRGVVVNGSYPVTVRGGTHGAVSYAYIYNYGTGKLSWELTNNICIFTTAGPGLIEFTNPLPGDLIIGGGVTRLTSESAYTSGSIRMFGDGVLEVGADLNGGSAGDFTRWVGTGGNNIYFYAGGGFSAYGADRTVNLGGSSSFYNWFIPEGFPLILGSPYANATLIFVNPLGMSFARREVRVHDGSAAVDARMTGNISGDGIAGLVKSGEGVLELTGKQAYYGDVSVIGGGLRLGADNIFAGGTNRLVIGDATLDAGTFANSFNTFELINDSRLELGDGSASLAFADSSETLWTGTLTITGSLNATTLRFGTDGSGLTPDQLASISVSGAWVKINDQGYLYPALKGTTILVR